MPLSLTIHTGLVRCRSEAVAGARDIVAKMTDRVPRARPMRDFTTRFVNPLIRPLAGILPGFAILTYPGRRSGRIYHTPMNTFRVGDHYWFALTYGPDVDWVKNVMAAGGCTIRTRGRDVRLVEPVLIHDPELRALPWLPRMIERLNGASDLVRMRIDPAA